MKSIRKWIRDVFGFSGNEINGFLILLPLMILLILSEPLYHSWVADGPREVESAPFDSIVAIWKKNRDTSVAASAVTPAALFQFDPNTVSVADLISLGLSERLATRIAAYRRKGGVFRVKSDLLRIYGLDSALYNQLYGYITLPDRPTAGITSPEQGTTARQPLSERRTEQKFDINTADTLRLKSVYGIGPRLAARIIKFRDGLGGFVNQNQLFEVYGLDSATVGRLREVSFVGQDFVPAKININTANQERLSAHPYISYHLARLLVSYRFQHGDFPDVTDIKKLSTITEEEVDRLLPYLIVE